MMKQTVQRAELVIKATSISEPAYEPPEQYPKIDILQGENCQPLRRADIPSQWRCGEMRWYVKILYFLTMNLSGCQWCVDTVVSTVEYGKMKCLRIKLLLVINICSPVYKYMKNVINV